MDVVFRLKPSVKEYPWGKIKQKSLVYELFKQYIDPKLDVDEDKRYSELWIGTHPSGPSTLLQLRSRNVAHETLNTPEALPIFSGKGGTSSHSIKNVEYLSDILEKFYSNEHKITDRSLRILLKVLSIDKPLSLQIHPDVQNAVKLLKQNHPSILDNSSKPEMLIALTKFNAIVGFRKLESILEYIKKYSELAEIVGEDILSDIKLSLTSNSYTTLGLIYVKLMKRIFTSTSLELLSSLIRKIETDGCLVEKIVLTLHKNYGYDICIIFPFIMNCITIDEGTAVFIPPNTIHSYIDGNCIEIMKNSDNVVRFGLTTKVTDPELCIELVESSISDNEPINLVHYIDPEALSKFTLKYQPRHNSCNFIAWSTIIPSKETDDVVLSNGCNIFLAIVVNTNPYAVIKVTCKEEVIIEHTNIGDCFLFFPETKLAIYNGGENDFVLYIASER